MPVGVEDVLHVPSDEMGRCNATTVVVAEKLAMAQQAAHHRCEEQFDFSGDVEQRVTNSIDVVRCLRVHPGSLRQGSAVATPNRLRRVGLPLTAQASGEAHGPCCTSEVRWMWREAESLGCNGRRGGNLSSRVHPGRIQSKLTRCQSGRIIHQQVQKKGLLRSHCIVLHLRRVLPSGVRHQLHSASAGNLSFSTAQSPAAGESIGARPTGHLFLLSGALSESLKARLVVGDALLGDRLPGLQIRQAVICIRKRCTAAVLRAIVD